MIPHEHAVAILTTVTICISTIDTPTQQCIVIIVLCLMLQGVETPSPIIVKRTKMRDDGSSALDRIRKKRKKSIDDSANSPTADSTTADVSFTISRTVRRAAIILLLFFLWVWIGKFTE